MKFKDDIMIHVTRDVCFVCFMRGLGSARSNFAEAHHRGCRALAGIDFISLGDVWELPFLGGTHFREWSFMGKPYLIAIDPQKGWLG